MRLTLNAEMLLLTQSPETGHPRCGARGFQAATAAVLVELSLRGRIVVDRGRVAVTDATPTGERLLDGLLRKLVGRRRPTPLRAALYLAQSDVLDATLAELADHGVVVRRTRRVLGLFRVTYWPEADAGPRAEVRRRLDAAVLHDQEPDQRTAALVALINGARLHRELFPYDLSFREGRVLRRRMAYLADGAWAVPALRDTVRTSHYVARAAVEASGSRGRGAVGDPGGAGGGG